MLTRDHYHEALAGMVEDFDQIGSSKFVQDLGEPVRTILADASGFGIVFPFWKDDVGCQLNLFILACFQGPELEKQQWAVVR